MGSCRGMGSRPSLFPSLPRSGDSGGGGKTELQLSQTQLLPGSLPTGLPSSQPPASWAPHSPLSYGGNEPGALGNSCVQVRAGTSWGLWVGAVLSRDSSALGPLLIQNPGLPLGALSWSPGEQLLSPWLDTEGYQTGKDRAPGGFRSCSPIWILMGSQSQSPPCRPWPALDLLVSWPLGSVFPPRLPLLQGG